MVNKDQNCSHELGENFQGSDRVRETSMQRFLSLEFSGCFRAFLHLLVSFVKFNGVKLSPAEAHLRLECISRHLLKQSGLFPMCDVTVGRLDSPNT